MRPDELFNYIWETEYIKSGFDLDWKVEADLSEKKIRVLFCPSNSKKDWVVNIAGFFPVFRFPIFYCFGWKKVFDGCKDIIIQEVIRHINNYPGYNIEICGHSYGGAMSQICGIELYKQTKIKADIITFGSPMPFFLLWSKFLSRSFYGSIRQYAHWSDIVTYCPPLPGYHNCKNNRIGKFKIKWLLKPNTYHMIYGDASLYEED